MKIGGYSPRLPGGRKGFRVIGVTVKIDILKLIKYFKNGSNRFFKDKGIRREDVPQL